MVKRNQDITTYVTEKQKERLDEVAEQMGMSRAEIMRSAIREKIREFENDLSERPPI